MSTHTHTNTECTCKSESLFTLTYICQIVPSLHHSSYAAVRVSALLLRSALLCSDPIWKYPKYPHNSNVRTTKHLKNDDKPLCAFVWSIKRHFLMQKPICIYVYIKKNERTNKQTNEKKITTKPKSTKKMCACVFDTLLCDTKTNLRLSRSVPDSRHHTHTLYPNNTVWKRTNLFFCWKWKLNNTTPVHKLQFHANINVEDCPGPER